MKAVFAAALAFAFLGTGCVAIDGGAVEVSWTIFAADGRGVINDCSCAEPGIASVQLKLAGPPGSESQVDPCQGTDACRFSCGRKTGSTPFIIPQGAYLMSIEPLTADGTLAAGAMVPDPIVSQVEKGVPDDLMAFEIQAPCALRCHGDDLTRACAAD